MVENPEVISLQGMSGAGKTTLVTRMLKYPDIRIIPEPIDYIIQKKSQLPPDPYDKNSFIKNQSYFIRIEQERWQQALEYKQKGYIVLFDRDPLDTIIFTFSYPYLFEPTWQVSDNLKDEIVLCFHENSLGIADRIVYLSAPEKILLSRIRGHIQRPIEEQRTIWLLDTFFRTVLSHSSKELKNRLSYIDTSAPLAAVEAMITRSIFAKISLSADKNNISRTIIRIVNDLAKQKYHKDFLALRTRVIRNKEYFKKKWPGNSSKQ